MRNTKELQHDVDSLKKEENNITQVLPNIGKSYFMYNFHPGDTTKPYKPSLAFVYRQPDSTATARLLDIAINSARNMRSYTVSYTERIKNLQRESNSFEVEKQRKYTQAVACFIMFLIGAPLGAIIKRGGLGFPVIVSITFFIIYYVISVMGEKLAIEGILTVSEGMWLANCVLIPFGLWFMNKARNDSRLLELDFIPMYYSKISEFVISKIRTKK
jgi:lipopolysaccharide export system permease protein